MPDTIESHQNGEFEILDLPSNRSHREPQESSNNHVDKIPFEDFEDPTKLTKNLLQAVKLPVGEDPQEWIASHIYDFFTQITMLWDTIEEFCQCDKMSGGSDIHYVWVDDNYYSAPDHIFRSLTWIKRLLDNQKLFPTKDQQPFPEKDGFRLLCKSIFRRMVEFFAHIYHCHHKDVKRLEQDEPVDTSFKHFVFFIKEFELIDESALKPLEDQINKAYL